jgi:hypothetical protein
MFRAYKVVVDGNVVGEIHNGESKDFDVAPGTHNLMLKVDWCHSRELPFDLSPGRDLEIDCTPSARGWAVLLSLYFVLFKRTDYIDLQPR